MLKRHARVAALALMFSVGLTAGAAWMSVELGGIPLDGSTALFAYALTETGGVRLVPVVLVFALAIWATDPSLSTRRRRNECVALLLVLLLALPAVAALVESVVKPRVAQPRPSHVAMADAGLITDLDAFYALDKGARRRLLASRTPTEASDAATLGIHSVILRHWFHESGSTFPSAHALNAFIAAALFLGGAVAAPTPRRRGLAVWLLTWAVAVSLSRVLLLLHRPLDVAVGAAIGALLGTLLLVPWWRWTQAR